MYKMKIIVGTLRNGQIVLEVNSNYTIEHTKMLIQEKCGHEVQNLTLNGTILIDKDTISECKIKNHDYIIENSKKKKKKKKKKMKKRAGRPPAHTERCTR